jgi:hypothetical protein
MERDTGGSLFIGYEQRRSLVDGYARVADIKRRVAQEAPEPVAGPKWKRKGGEIEDRGMPSSRHPPSVHVTATATTLLLWIDPGELRTVAAG